MGGHESDARQLARQRHAINNMLNGLSMQAELCRHYLDRNDADAAEQCLARIIADCKRYSEEVSTLLEPSP